MGIPELFVQSMIVAPTMLQASIKIGWNAQANHTICTVQVTEGPTHVLLASSTGSLPTFREPLLLSNDLDRVTLNLVNELALLTKRSEPF